MSSCGWRGRIWNDRKYKSSRFAFNSENDRIHGILCLVAVAVALCSRDHKYAKAKKDKKNFWKLVFE